MYLTGFREGPRRYTVSTPGRRPTRVTFDAARWPLPARAWASTGRRTGFPYWGKFFGLIITPTTGPARTGGTSS